MKNYHAIIITAASLSILGCGNDTLPDPNSAAAKAKMQTLICNKVNGTGVGKCSGTRITSDMLSSNAADFCGVLRGFANQNRHLANIAGTDYKFVYKHTGKQNYVCTV